MTDAQIREALEAEGYIVRTNPHDEAFVWHLTLQREALYLDVNVYWDEAQFTRERIVGALTRARAPIPAGLEGLGL